MYRPFPHVVGCFLLLGVLFAGCRPSAEGPEVSRAIEGKLRVVATTSMIADLVRTIGDDCLSVEGLMGPGVDPHLYKASEGDVLHMAGADLIFYNGLHLEGKMTEVFEQMQRRHIWTVALAEEALEESSLIRSSSFSGNYDPHVWFDVSLWMRVAEQVRDVLVSVDSVNADAYTANTERYLNTLASLHQYVLQQAEKVPADKRVLITSHDAFGYFGRAYDFEVKALQGLSTATEAGAADVQTLSDFVAGRRIPAMFVESSVSPRGIKAVQAAVEARGFNVIIGGNLYSDALGDPKGPEGTFEGTVRYNIDTIVNALAPSDS